MLSFADHVEQVEFYFTLSGFKKLVKLQWEAILHYLIHLKRKIVCETMVSFLGLSPGENC